jgi:predicted metal-dependent phosphoesterase TrpH
VAAELVECGHVSTIEAAFDVYLATDRPAYEAKAAMGLADAAALLRAAGAVPVLAHPGASAVEPLLPRLREAGVLGLEVWHPKHDSRLVRRYLGLAEHQGLLPTGGSDFHRIAPGCVRPGDLGLPLAVLDALRPHAS